MLSCQIRQDIGPCLLYTSSGCGVATLSISYYDLGYTTGEMAAKVLTGEADISTCLLYTSILKSMTKCEQ